MRNTKILNVRIPTELHDALTARAEEGSESLAWATRYILRVGLQGHATMTAIQARIAAGGTALETPPPDPQRSAGGSRKGRRAPVAAKTARKARKGGK